MCQRVLLATVNPLFSSSEGLFVLSTFEEGVAYERGAHLIPSETITSIKMRKKRTRVTLSQFLFLTRAMTDLACGTGVIFCVFPRARLSSPEIHKKNYACSAG